MCENAGNDAGNDVGNDVVGLLDASKSTALLFIKLFTATTTTKSNITLFYY